MVYLRQHPPARSQYRSPRRMKPTGLIVVHTAESAMDTVGPDTGAENVAAFIARRTDAPGSYHIIADSDSRIRLVRFTDEAYGDGTGSNLYAMHLSAACRTVDWKNMSSARKAGYVKQMAEGAATYARWVKKQYGITIPAKRVSRDESSAGRPGFISHGERDPGRRTDPGSDFPWDDFIASFSRIMGYDKPNDTKLIPLTVEARKKVNAAAIANRQAARALRQVEAEAKRVGRNNLAANFGKRAGWFTSQAKAAVKRRKWVNGRTQWLRKR